MINNNNANSAVYVESVSKEDFKQIIKDMMEEVVKPIKVDLASLKGTTTYTIKEAADRIGKSNNTIYRYILLGKIKAAKRGGNHIITHENLQDFIKG